MKYKNKHSLTNTLEKEHLRNGIKISYWRTKKITLLQLDGVLTPEEYKKCVDVGVQGCKIVYDIQKKALKDKYFGKGED